MDEMDEIMKFDVLFKTCLNENNGFNDDTQITPKDDMGRQIHNRLMGSLNVDEFNITNEEWLMIEEIISNTASEIIKVLSPNVQKKRDNRILTPERF